MIYILGEKIHMKEILKTGKNRPVEVNLLSYEEYEQLKFAVGHVRIKPDFRCWCVYEFSRGIAISFGLFIEDAIGKALSIIRENGLKKFKNELKKHEILNRF